MEHQDWTPVYVRANKELNKTPEQKDKEKKREENQVKFASENKIEKQIEDGNLKHKKMDVSFGKELQKKRLGKGLTQKDLAQKLNIPAKDINDIEAGKAKHNPGLMNKINRTMK
jgi:ribosome-binding protein aMBF1 (putative translation factor)